MSKPRTLRIIAAAVALVAVVATQPGSGTAAAKPRNALQEALDRVAEAGAPGAFAEVRDGGREWAGATGLAELSNARPMRPWFHHRIGSITKTFVATTVLQLVGEGRLGLDDPIGRWLPDLVPGELGQQVTVRMLLNHTSGIGNYTNAIFGSLAGVEQTRTTRYTPEQLVAIGLELPRTGAPGARHSYSNTGYIIAGLLIQRITGRDPADEITRRIIRPLRLDDTYFPGTDPTIRGPHAGAYLALLGVRDLSVYQPSWSWMVGDLISTTDDMNDFFRALLGGRLLSPALLAQMRTTVPFDPARPELGEYGLGIYTWTTPCGPVWGHDGVVIGQITYSLHTPDLRRQVSYAMNISTYQVTDEAHPIDVAMLGFLTQALCPGETAMTAQAPLPRTGVRITP